MVGLAIATHAGPWARTKTHVWTNEERHPQISCEWGGETSGLGLQETGGEG